MIPPRRSPRNKLMQQPALHQSQEMLMTPAQQQILDEVRDFRKEVSVHITETRDRLITLETTTAKLPERVTALERMKWQILGGASVVSTALAYIFRHVI